MSAVVDWPTKKEHGRNPFFEDIAGTAETLKANAQRMFITTDAIDVEACIVRPSGCKPQRIRSLKELEKYLNTPENLPLASNDPVQSATRIFFVRQSHSRAPIQISEDAMKLLLSKQNVFPEFIRILSGFKLQTQEVFGGAAACNRIYCIDEKNTLDNSVFETAYILKHVEKNTRQHLPWSIRQMAVYQQYNTTTKTSDCLLIQTSARVKLRIVEIVKDSNMAELSTHWTHLHELHLGTLSHNWDVYFAYINGVVSDRNRDYLFSKVEGGTERVSFVYLQGLNVLRDQLSAMCHALELNLEVLDRLSQEAARRETIEGEKFAERYAQFQTNLRTCIMEQTFLKQQAIHVRQDADRLFVHLRDTIALQDSNVMMALNQKTIQEARTMRTITLVALVYLPASFTATFLAMGYVHIESLSGVMKINVAPEMWFYLAVTAPLMVVTFLVWGMWEWWSRRRVRARSRERVGLGDEEEGMDENVKVV